LANTDFAFENKFALIVFAAGFASAQQLGLHILKGTLFVEAQHPRIKIT